MSTGNNAVSKDLTIDAAERSPAIAPSSMASATTMVQQSQHCLRDNECSQQQLVRLVGYRGPTAVAGAWDRLRLKQAAQIAS